MDSTPACLAELVSTSILKVLKQVQDDSLVVQDDKGGVQRIIKSTKFCFTLLFFYASLKLK